MPGRDPQQFGGSTVLVNDADAQRACAQRIIDAMEASGFGDAACFAVRLALEEAIVNAFKHGSAGIKDPRVKLAWAVAGPRVTVTIADEGPGFNPDKVPDPTQPDRIEVPTGRGVMLMRAYMTEVSFNTRGNEVTMVYDRAAPPNPGGG